MKKLFLIGAATFALAACSAEKETHSTPQEVPKAETPVVEETTEVEEVAKPRDLDAILASQPENAQERYQYRNPKETLEFFGIEPGMTVVEVLPGGGWYSKILLPYLGTDGMLVGADYNLEMWPLFGGFANDDFLEKRKSWVETWAMDAEEWRDETSAPVRAVALGAIPGEYADSADAVLMVRAFHHLNRFEDAGGFRSAALADVMTVLKPGGIVGIVQHRAPEDIDDAWANGDNGYVKQSVIVTVMEEAGFEFVEASEINANLKDQPTTEDMVWRLPPTLGTSKEDAELEAKMKEIGESDRMTLMFRKPA